VKQKRGILKNVHKVVAVKSPVKWAGGKTQLLSQLRPLFLKRFMGKR
jgi:hypothetical protein